MNSRTFRIFSNLDELRATLKIPEINTGAQISLTGQSGLITDYVEGLHATQNESGHLHLVSGVEFQIFQYRGQNQEYTPCIPTLGRIKDLEERLLSICRCVAFEEAILSHPFVRTARQYGIYVDYKGLAQHYGMSTDMLDVTANFDVASFFATCRWDRNKGSYVPMGESDLPGVIYRINLCVLLDRQPESVHLVGWQPLPRPEQQRASAIQIKPGHDFCDTKYTTERAYFYHNREISNRIFEAFDGGNQLFPFDPCSNLSRQAHELREFTEQQLREAWSRLEDWEGVTYPLSQRITLAASANIKTRSENILTWNGLNVESREERLTEMVEAVLNRTRYRRAMYLLK